MSFERNFAELGNDAGRPSTIDRQFTGAIVDLLYRDDAHSRQDSENLLDLPQDFLYDKKCLYVHRILVSSRLTIPQLMEHETQTSSWKSRSISESSPCARVSFKSAEDSARAWSLVAGQRPTIGLPNRGMVVDIVQLEKLKAAGIPLYPPVLEGREGQYGKPLEVHKVIETLRSVQEAVRKGGRSSIRSEPL